MRFAKLLLLSVGLTAQLAYAHGPKPGPLINVPVPEVPGLLDGSDPIVVDKDKAIALGKALFWDTAVGSDGMSCGSCHFHAGADGRVKNQINPGLKNSDTVAGESFDMLGSGEGGPNHTLTQADFPLHKRVNPFDQDSAVVEDTDDAVASAGTFSGEFQNASRFGDSNDNCQRGEDAIFNVGGVHSRRVEPRNAPTVINSIFNFRNFWDGRANNVFNGSSPWGDRDPNAGVWVKNGRSIRKQRLHLENSSLASLAMAPPLSDTEMSCRNRTLVDIGRKVLLRQPLQNQKVHYQDSVFGPQGLVNSTADSELPGLKTTYKTLIRQAFNRKYWSYAGSSRAFPAPPAGQSAYNQMEVNFPMFFGLALQLYQGTLISDQAPIDLVPRILGASTAGNYLNPDWAALYPDDTNKVEQLKNGFNMFMANHCSTCHGGPVVTVAALEPYSKIVASTPGAYYGPSSAPIYYGKNALGPNGGAAVAGITSYRSVVARDVTRDKKPFEDIGFANTGVGNPEADPGLGGVDDFGNPLSFSYQYQQYLLGYNENIVDGVVYGVRACDFPMPLVDPFGSTEPDPVLFNESDELEIDGQRDGVNKTRDCVVSDNYGLMNVPKIPTVAAARAALGSAKMEIGTKAAFKIPSLRNVELTGPYMHNGSMATLEQVIEFYSRHGNFVNPDQHQFVKNINLVGSTLPLGSSINMVKNREDLIAFLKTFTDDRVRYQRAPFDHPEVKVPHGHVGDASAVAAGNDIDANLAKDEFLIVPAVGANGSAEPLQPFDSLLAP